MGIVPTSTRCSYMKFPLSSIPPISRIFSYRRDNSSFRRTSWEHRMSRSPMTWPSSFFCLMHISSVEEMILCRFFPSDLKSAMTCTFSYRALYLGMLNTVGRNYDLNASLHFTFVLLAWLLSAWVCVSFLSFFVVVVAALFVVVIDRMSMQEKDHGKRNTKVKVARPTTCRMKNTTYTLICKEYQYHYIVSNVINEYPYYNWGTKLNLILPVEY